MDGIFLISLKEARLHGNYDRGIGNYQENSLRWRQIKKKALWNKNNLLTQTKINIWIGGIN